MMKSSGEPNMHLTGEAAAAVLEGGKMVATSSDTKNESGDGRTGSYTPNKDGVVLQQEQGEIATSRTPWRLADTRTRQGNARASTEENSDSATVRMLTTCTDLVVASRKGMSDAKDDPNERSIPTLLKSPDTAITYPEQMADPAATGGANPERCCTEAREAFTLPSRSTSASSVEQHMSQPIPRLLAATVAVRFRSLDALHAKNCPVEPSARMREQMRTDGDVVGRLLGAESRTTEEGPGRFPKPAAHGEEVDRERDAERRTFNVIPPRSPPAQQCIATPARQLNQMPEISSASKETRADSANASRQGTSNATSTVPKVFSPTASDRNVGSIFTVYSPPIPSGHETNEQKTALSSPQGQNITSPERLLSIGPPPFTERPTYKTFHSSPLRAKWSESEESACQLTERVGQIPISEGSTTSCRGEDECGLPMVSRDSLSDSVRRKEADKQTASDPAPPRVPLTSTILADRRSVFYKTQMCPHAIRGRCRLDKRCSFAHSKRELRTPPKLDKTKICASVKAGILCPNGDACSFAHSRNELRHTVAFYKTNMCRNWKAGACLHPETCNHAHGMYELLFFRSLAAGSGCRDFKKEEEVCMGMGSGTGNLDSAKNSDTNDWKLFTGKDLEDERNGTSNGTGVRTEDNRRVFASSTLESLTRQQDLLSNSITSAPSQGHQYETVFLTSRGTEQDYKQRTSYEQPDPATRRQYCLGSFESRIHSSANRLESPERRKYSGNENIQEAGSNKVEIPVHDSTRTDKGRVRLPSEGGSKHGTTGTRKGRKRGSGAFAGCRNGKAVSGSYPTSLVSMIVQNRNRAVSGWKQERPFVADDRYSCATVNTLTTQKQVDCSFLGGCGKETVTQVCRGTTEVGGDKTACATASQVESPQTYLQSTSLQKENIVTRKDMGMKRRGMRKTAENFTMMAEVSEAGIRPPPPPPPPKAVEHIDLFDDSALGVAATGLWPFLSAVAGNTQHMRRQKDMQLLLLQLQRLKRAQVDHVSGELLEEVQQQLLKAATRPKCQQQTNAGGMCLQRKGTGESRTTELQEGAELHDGSENEDSYLKRQFSSSELLGEGSKKGTRPGNRELRQESDTTNAALIALANKLLPSMVQPYSGRGANMPAVNDNCVRHQQVPAICQNALIPAVAVEDDVPVRMGCKTPQEPHPSIHMHESSSHEYRLFDVSNAASDMPVPPVATIPDLAGVNASVALQRAASDRVHVMYEEATERLTQEESSMEAQTTSCSPVNLPASLSPAPLPNEETGSFECMDTGVSWSITEGSRNVRPPSVSPGAAVEIVGISNGLPALASPQTWILSRTDVADNVDVEWDRREAARVPFVTRDESSPEAEAAEVFAALCRESAETGRRSTEFPAFPYPPIDIAQRALVAEKNHRRRQRFEEASDNDSTTVEKELRSLSIEGASVSRAVDWLAMALPTEDSCTVHSRGDMLPGRADCAIRTSLGPPVPVSFPGTTETPVQLDTGLTWRDGHELWGGDMLESPQDIPWMPAALPGHEDHVTGLTSPGSPPGNAPALTAIESRSGFLRPLGWSELNGDAGSFQPTQAHSGSTDTTGLSLAVIRQQLEVREATVVKRDKEHADGETVAPRFDVTSETSPGSPEGSAASSDNSGSSEPSWDASVGATPSVLESSTPSTTAGYGPPTWRNKTANCVIVPQDETGHKKQLLVEAEKCFEEGNTKSFCTISGQQIRGDALLGDKSGAQQALTSLPGEDSSSANRIESISAQCSVPEDFAVPSGGMNEADLALLKLKTSIAGMDYIPSNHDPGHASCNQWRLTRHPVRSNLVNNDEEGRQISCSVDFTALAGKAVHQGQGVPASERALHHIWNLDTQQAAHLSLGQRRSPAVQSKHGIAAEDDAALGPACRLPFRKSVESMCWPCRRLCCHSETETQSSVDTFGHTSVDPLTLIEGMMHALGFEGYKHRVNFF
uniref:Zinc finger (CCCH type) motif-containing protein n=1 Tax=Toxoplasma gondii COUG TaxID=1074873 RepID=A0A2G8YA46_TOXGO|nr:zinc finger (CCCH type) motif-containing protein [Toxoplasma gondii COUG]